MLIENRAGTEGLKLELSLRGERQNAEEPPRRIRQLASYAVYSWPGLGDLGLSRPSLLFRRPVVYGSIVYTNPDQREEQGHCDYATFTIVVRSCIARGRWMQTRMDRHA